MSKQLINLTLSIVIDEIENILATYPKYPYQQAFSDCGLRQNLVTYVLRHVPNQYTVVEETQSSSNITKSLRCSSVRLLNIEHWIHLGIRDILHIYNRSNCYLPQKVTFPSTASSLYSSRLN